MAVRWLGRNWGDRSNSIGGLRLLVLGESHYHASAAVGSDVPTMTFDAVSSHINGGKHRFFTYVRKLVEYGGPQTSREEFWHSVVFYNYIPEVVANMPRRRPPKHLWEKSAPREFQNVLNEVQPEAILVCGRELWRKMARGSVDRPDAYLAAGRSWYEREYVISPDKVAVASHIAHPSSVGWKVQTWLPVMDHLRRRVQEIKTPNDYLCG